MNEAHRRELAEWMQEKAIRRVLEDRERQQSRLMSMRWVWRRMLTLQWTAVNRLEFNYGDARFAFLQGDGQEMQDPEPIYARALDEIECAMKVL